MSELRARLEAFVTVLRTRAKGAVNPSLAKVFEEVAYELDAILATTVQAPATVVLVCPHCHARHGAIQGNHWKCFNCHVHTPLQELERQPAGRRRASEDG